jgi:hypothetical protein
MGETSHVAQKTIRPHMQERNPAHADVTFFEDFLKFQDLSEEKRVVAPSSAPAFPLS